ncbi:MAG: cellulase family glycosylhydrolase [Bacteroidales bacterium]|nr:cellulase family glycosylhydrolase [Bacteroidales bacterium]
MRNLTFMFIAVILLAACSKSSENAGLTFLKTQGQDIVNESGEKIYLRGVGLGNWLLPEGYMWKFGENGDRPRKIEKIVSDLIGNEKASDFWYNFRKNYITEADIQRIAALGFNSVRPALNSRLFVTEGENPVFIDEGFLLLDSLVQWCKKHQIYVIIDMHGAPGGQTGQNIDDSPNNEPELFMYPKNQDLLLELWMKIVNKYKDEPAVAAYNLINEPLPERTGAAEKYKHLLVPLYERLISEIRKVDAKHMITVEGYNWSNNWSLFEQPLDSNIFYQFHYYCWNRPDNLNSIDYFLKKREQLNTPVWVGETGEQGVGIYWATTQYFETNNIGFSFWPWKKMDTQNTPYSINKPENWDLIAEYSKGGEKPDSIIAVKAFDDLLENIKLANCEYYQDVVNAIFARIPAKIEAENYGHLGFNKSYFVNDTSVKSNYYRTNEPVQVNLIESDEKSRTSQQYIYLQQDEWIAYNFNNLEAKKYDLKLKLSADKLPVDISISINDKPIDYQYNKEGWNEVLIGEYDFKQGGNNIKFKLKNNQLKIDWLLIE